MDEFFEWVLQLKMIFLNESFNLKDELFVCGRSIKIQGKKNLGMLYVQGKAPM